MTDDQAISPYHLRQIYVSLTGMLQRGSESGGPEETESYTSHHQENGKYETNVE